MRERVGKPPGADLQNCNPLGGKFSPRAPQLGGGGEQGARLVDFAGVLARAASTQARKHGPPIERPAQLLRLVVVRVVQISP